MNQAIQIAVLSAARREFMTEKTVADLDSRGCAHAIPCEKRLFYWAPPSFAAPKLPQYWTLERRNGPRNPLIDFVAMIHDLNPTIDALLFEDDVYPATGALLDMLARPVPDDCAFASFYDFRSLLTSDSEPIRLRPQYDDYWGAQAIRMPARLIAAIQAEEYPIVNRSQDAWLGLVAGKRREFILQHRSYVQHIGRTSLGSPGVDLTELRAPSTSFPEPYWLAPMVDPFCTFHGCTHPQSAACPFRGE